MALLKAYIVSDVHLNSHRYGHDALHHQRFGQGNFLSFLRSLTDEMRPEEHVILVLNGDILDLNESWFAPLVPWDADVAQVEALVLSVLQTIVTNNEAVFHALHHFVMQPNVELVYVFGNHDALLERFPSAQQFLREVLLKGVPEAEGRLRFCAVFEHEALSLHVEHGHRLDAYNQEAGWHDPSLGDVVNVLVVNGFEQRVAAKMQQQGYTDSDVQAVWLHLADIGFLRPLTLFPLWLEMMPTHNMTLDATQHEALKQLIREALYDILQERSTVQYFVEKLHVPAWALKLLAKASLSLPVILPALSYGISKLVHRASSNARQYEAAQKLSAKGYRLIVFGHTHAPAVESLEQGGYYFNTGSWLPIIRLVSRRLPKTSLRDYLDIGDRFRKMYNCSVLRLEKDLANPQRPAEYYLQTLKTGPIFEQGS